MMALRTAIPDLHIDVENMVAERDLVSVRILQRGTMRQPLFGLGPTGAPIAFTSTILFRFRGDRVVEEWIDTNIPPDAR